MKVKFILEEDFVNYKKPNMFIGTCFCDFKCCHEIGAPESMCQNEPWFQEPIKEIGADTIIHKYTSNPFTTAIVFGGMEPLLQFEEIVDFIQRFRKISNDDIVIYTGYNKDEILDKIQIFQNNNIKNIIIKFGRYRPNEEKHFDEVLGVNLASSNQYAEKIS